MASGACTELPLGVVVAQERHILVCGLECMRAFLGSKRRWKRTMDRSQPQRVALTSRAILSLTATVIASAHGASTARLMGPTETAQRREPSEVMAVPTSCRPATIARASRTHEVPSKSCGMQADFCSQEQRLHLS